MPDYIYLLEKRLSADQQNALHQLREAAREAEMLLFLTGDAVRDLTSGQAVRELEIAVQGNALKLKKIVENLGGTVWGEDPVSRTLYLCFPGTVRVDVVSTHRVEYSKPGKPVFYPASIQEDLRRRDFTVNAMAVSLNEGSFGLLMDPLNGVADIEAGSLRLVSNYGFLEEPSLLIRATRYLARLGWVFDPRTQTRYENAKGEGVIEYLSDAARSQELEQIGHEADGLKVLEALDAEGWMKVLFPSWTPAKADEEKLKALHDLAVELLQQGVHADMSAAQIQLLTAKLASKDLAALKKLMLRPGFVEEWNSLDALAAGFSKALLAKEHAAPSASYKLFTSYDPEAVLWLGFTSKDAAVKERFNLFMKVWPEVRQRIPHALLQEMRITAELSAYQEIVHSIFLELLDGRLATMEEIRAFLEPHSPPAPPPQVTIKRPRAKRGAEAKQKEQSYDEDGESEEERDEEEELDEIGGDDDEIDMGLPIPKIAMDIDLSDDSDSDGDAEDEESESEPEPAPVKRGAGHQDQGKLAKNGHPDRASHAGKADKKVLASPVAKPESKAASTAAAKSSGSVPSASHLPGKASPAPAVRKVAPSSTPLAKDSKAGKSRAQKSAVGKTPAKVQAHPTAKPAVKPVTGRSVKPALKTAGKSPVKVAAKPAVKLAPAKGKPAVLNSKTANAHASKAAKPAQKKATAPAAKKR